MAEMNDAKLEVLEELIEALGGADILGRLQKRMADKKKHEASETPTEEKEENGFDKKED